MLHESMESPDIRKIARQIFESFQMACRAQLYEARCKAVDFNRAAQLKNQVFSDLSVLDKPTRKHFEIAAQYCVMMGADPRDYVAAQFSKFEELSKDIGRWIIPSPGSLSTLAAQVRYIECMKRKAERTDKKPPKTEVSKWYRESRRLKGLAKALRMSESDVLAERPEEFSKEYLEYRGVWSIVRDIWIERTA